MDKKELAQKINQIAIFLANRAVPELTKTELRKRYHISKTDAIMLFGNELLYTLETAAEAMKKNLADQLVICGGEGHSTDILRKNIESHSKYRTFISNLKGKSEAEIFGILARELYEIPEEKILLDTSSSNCGENAVNGMKILRKKKASIGHIILIQDPIMQIRSKASLEKQVHKEQIISYAPFIPQVREDLSYTIEISGLWKKERFLELILGEIPRLQDNEKGYGPKGQGFIVHVDIPEKIIRAYEEVREELQEADHRGI